MSRHSNDSDGVVWLVAIAGAAILAAAWDRVEQERKAEAAAVAAAQAAAAAANPPVTVGSPTGMAPPPPGTVTDPTRYTRGRIEIGYPTGTVVEQPVGPVAVPYTAQAPGTFQRVEVRSTRLLLPTRVEASVLAGGRILKIRGRRGLLGTHPVDEWRVG
jgi:hypothetical protein